MSLIKQVGIGFILTFATTVTLSTTVAEVNEVEVVQRIPYADGRVFPGIGSYERLIGRISYSIDPRLSVNQTVIDLKSAPVNDQGRVEFRSDFEILCPVNPAKSNGTLLYDVNNRGDRRILDYFNTAADEFLMRHGYIVVWSGWIAELLPGQSRLRLEVPQARQDGQLVVGTVRAEMVTDVATDRLNISSRVTHGSYPPTERGMAQASLTWRLRESDTRVVIPRAQWNWQITSVTPDPELRTLPRVEVVLPSGFHPGYIYELIYEAEGSLIQGLGLAGIRDLVSFLRKDSSIRNPLCVSSGASVVQRTIGWGVSQSGRCLRMFLYDGFNIDGDNQQVFDGIIPHVSGGGLGFFNHRFSSPTRYNTQHNDHAYPCDVFPFSYGSMCDPVTGRTDGILDRSRRNGTVPKIMHVQTSAEYWNRSGSLVHTDPLGTRDAKLPPEVRLYAIGGAQHGAGNDRPGSVGKGQLAENPTDYRPVLRALLISMDRWIQKGIQPPESRYPRIDDGTLVHWTQSGSGWTALPGVRYPEVIHQPDARDYGPEFMTRRFIRVHPPRNLNSYRVRVPAYNQDNNERGMLLLPHVTVPVATFTGWNLRNPTTGAASELMRLQGSYIPFPKDRMEQLRRGDSRLSVQDRYQNFDDYIRQVKRAIAKLVDNGYILLEDREMMIDRAGQNHHYFGIQRR
ncbi:MAG: alpha/beta hydrolase domain-containing protein [Planctomycetota bacterium]|nr:alpha/beta hydrolase domain-containing protein [Planctomycetota bacterium]